MTYVRSMISFMHCEYEIDLHSKLYTGHAIFTLERKLKLYEFIFQFTLIIKCIQKHMYNIILI